MGFLLQDRGGLFVLDPKHPDALAPHKRPFHTIIPAFMERGDQHIGFGIMGAVPIQPLAHAQFVSDVVDYGWNIQAALSAPRFTIRDTGKPIKCTTPSGVAGLARSAESPAPEGPRLGSAKGLFRIDGTGTGSASQFHNRDEFCCLYPRADGSAEPEAMPTKKVGAWSMNSERFVVNP